VASGEWRVARWRVNSDLPRASARPSFSLAT